MYQGTIPSHNEVQPCQQYARSLKDSDGHHNFMLHVVFLHLCHPSPCSNLCCLWVGKREL